MNVDEFFKEMLGDEYEEPINEGLIRTINPEKVIELIDLGKTKIEGYPTLYDNGILGIKFQMVKNVPRVTITPESLRILEQAMNNFGYYPAQYRSISTMLKFKTFSHSIISDSIRNKKGDLVEIVYHPKFSTPIKRIELPKHLYHICDGSVLSKILKIGLSPRTQNKIEIHPERVYLCQTQKCLENLMKHPNFNRFSTSPDIYVLKIEVEKIKNEIDFYTDVSLDDALYIHQNIPPSNIEVIGKHKKK